MDTTDVPKQRAKSSSHVAERMRLYRKRRRVGLRSVRIWLPVTDIDYFIRVVLTDRQRQRPDARVTRQWQAVDGTAKNPTDFLIFVFL
jgi:hypothetical protein